MSEVVAAMRPPIVEMLQQISKHISNLRLYVDTTTDYSYIDVGMFRFSAILDKPGALFENVVLCADTLLNIPDWPKCWGCKEHQAQWRVIYDINMCSYCVQKPLNIAIPEANLAFGFGVKTIDIEEVVPL